MTTCLGKSCSFGLPRVPFVNCCQFMYLVISLLVLRAGCGLCLYQFLIIAYPFTENLKGLFFVISPFILFGQLGLDLLLGCLACQDSSFVSLCFVIILHLPFTLLLRPPVYFHVH